LYIEVRLSFKEALKMNANKDDLDMSNPTDDKKKPAADIKRAQSPKLKPGEKPPTPKPETESDPNIHG
jgi:hypothetical protein